MKKFLVLYRMDMAEMQKMMASTSAEERKKSMGEWEVWMKKNMASFADHGGPVGKTKQAAASGATDIKNDIGGYSIVQAESHEAAAALFADNPHLTMPESGHCVTGSSRRLRTHPLVEQIAAPVLQNELQNHTQSFESISILALRVI